MVRDRRPRVWAAAVAGGSLLGLLLGMVLFSLAAVLLGLAGDVAAQAAELIPSLDPVYTHAALRSLADLHLQGVAVVGPPGDWLHQILPDFFVESARAHWSPARVVVVKGSPVLARLVAAGLANAGVLAAGLLLVRRGLRRRRWLVLAGVAAQAQVALGILGAPPTLRELEATGVSFAANALVPWMALRGEALSDVLAGVWPPLVSGSLVGLALVIGYLPTALVLLLRDRTWRRTLGTALVVVVSSAACASVLQDEMPPPAADVAPAPLAPLAAQAPVVALLPGEPPLTDVPTVSLPGDLTLDRWYVDFGAQVTPPPPSPSHVEVVGSDYQYHYVVNGTPQVIKGMGLNTQYTQQLSPSDRAARVDADMAALAQLGVNTVLGWDPAEFDEVLLDAAERHGIGVIMPFDLDPEADYTDPDVRAQLHDQVMAWVARYRQHPALRMWGLGNEVLHKIVHPAWVGPQDPQRERNAEAFSDWLVQTADDIHAADADHPVTYREAEDAFIPWLSAALKRAGDGPRPWFVLGTNCYQDYLSQIVDNWPAEDMPTALWVSEFAPGGMAIPDRPDGFQTMWGYIRRHPDWVLGGAVYAWTRNGPEGVDRNFGLTDDGEPVDGRSLDALSELFHLE